LIDRKLTESQFVEMVDYINRTKIDFVLLTRIKEIIDLLADDNFNIGSELLVVLYDIKKISKGITKFIDTIIKSDSFFSEKMKSIDMEDNLTLKSYNVITEAEKYIKSFMKLAINSPSEKNKNNVTPEIENDLSIGTNKKKSKYEHKFIIEQFESNCKEEILNRLILLKNYFGIEFIGSLDITIITIADFDEMKFNDSVKYYFDCVKKIKRCIGNHLILYKNYVRLFEHYNNLLSHNHVEDLKLLDLKYLDEDPIEESKQEEPPFLLKIENILESI
jgi:hypothetical protein